MAYLNHLFSLSADLIPGCTSWSLIRSGASHSIACSHLISYWIDVQPLGELLRSAVDGGKILDSCWRHTLRVPKVHTPSDVAALSLKLADAWDIELQNGVPLLDDDWGKIEVEKVLSLFGHAAMKNEAVISILEQSYYCDQ